MKTYKDLNLKITIEGEQGTGKSILLQKIKDMLVKEKMSYHWDNRADLVVFTKINTNEQD